MQLGDSVLTLDQASQRPATDTYEGIYLPIEVSGYLLATMPAEQRPPTSQRIFRWIRHGLVPPEVKDVPGRKITITFADLVTCQAVALFREAGLSLAAIRQAEQFFAGLYSLEKPFAYQQFWYSPRDIFGRMQGTLISGTRSGQIAWDFLRDGLQSWPNALQFSPQTKRATAWFPAEGISLEPDVEFGQPCLAGTRIPTGALWSYAIAGTPIGSIARSYGIEVKQVEQAVAWEKRVRAKLDSPAEVPAG